MPDITRPPSADEPRWRTRPEPAAIWDTPGSGLRTPTSYKQHQRRDGYYAQGDPQQPGVRDRNHMAWDGTWPPSVRRKSDGCNSDKPLASYMGFPNRPSRLVRSSRVTTLAMSADRCAYRWRGLSRTQRRHPGRRPQGRSDSRRHICGFPRWLEGPARGRRCTIGRVRCPRHSPPWRHHPWFQSYKSVQLC